MELRKDKHIVYREKDDVWKHWGPIKIYLVCYSLQVHPATKQALGEKETENK